MERLGLFLYGFARAGALDGVELSGLVAGEPVAAFECRAIAAVYSRVQSSEFESALADGKPPDPDWLIPRACLHEHVLESVMELSDVLPVRFGALFSSIDALASFTEQHAEKILGFLDEVTGKQEWSVKLLVDLDRLADLLIESEPDLAERWASLPRSPGTRYFHEKRLRSEARSRAAQLGRVLAAELKAQVEKTEWTVQPLPVRGSGAGFLLHLAVLLPGSDIGRLDRLVEAVLRSRQGSVLRVERTGPWPPSHFCPVLEATTPCELEVMR